MLIKTLHYVIKAIHATSLEAILCFVNESGSSNYIDVRLSIPQREDFIQTLKTQYQKLVQSDKKYKVYGIPDKSLRDYRMGSQFEVEPDQKFRIQEEEI